jgi:hypothetical protein
MALRASCHKPRELIVREAPREVAVFELVKSVESTLKEMSRHRHRWGPIRLDLPDSYQTRAAFVIATEGE